MTYSEILKLTEGVHVVEVNTETCMVVRLREGFTLTTVLPKRRLLIQHYSERANLLWEEIHKNPFAPIDKKTKKRSQTDESDNR